ncbi:hypothetical protein CAEBREN_20069 [Caenorhabditis brenneri]|uniref:Uncharacterized protein n=1 Tax=Caenorhabditis brenneri TaxID=135651 RepID=G0PJX1_CAEBE|nr:hypothetical protein CAEBREN_20069 [Caenorhabditis brenneri]
MKLVILCLILALPVISCQTTSRPSFGGGSIFNTLFGKIEKLTQNLVLILNSFGAVFDYIFGILENVFPKGLSANGSLGSFFAVLGEKTQGLFSFFNNGLSGISDFLGLGHLRLGGLVGGLAGGARIPSNDAAETAIASELEAKPVEAIPQFVLRGERQLNMKRDADWIRDPP